MTLKTIKELRDAAPFKPFDVHLADGRAFTVVTPDHLFVMPNSNSREFLIVLPDDAFRIIDISQVTSIGRGPRKASTH